ncbi:MAG: ATP-binding cassette domain-containing protein, partial [Alphaproteobacteria bacterium]|nr:ATP-binding cassette domain-containing protein [Alphaproteobacteria bacterium]
MAEQNHIEVRGAREHNLKSVDVDIPRNQFVVITGLSGSGKSSLAFDTIYAEGQPETGLPIEAQQVQDMVDRVLNMEHGTRAYLLAPIVRDRKGEYKKEFLELRKSGFQRVKVNSEFYDLDEPPVLDKKFRHNIDVVVDRIVIKEEMATRLADSFRTALDLADGI